MAKLSLTIVARVFDYNLEIDESTIPDSVDQTSATEVLSWAKQNGLVDFNDARISEVQIFDVRKKEN